MRLLFEALADSQESVQEVVARYIPDPRWVDRLAKVRPASDADQLVENAATVVFNDVLGRLKLRIVDEAIEQTLEQMKHASAEELVELEQRKRSLTRSKQQLKRPRKSA
jgi:hypothetical protein